MAATIPGAGITTPLTLTEDGNTDTLTIKSTDADANAGPILNLHRDSSSPADADLIGSIRFSVDNDAGEQVNLFQTNCFALDVSDGTEDFQFEFDGLIAGTKRAFFTMNNDGFVFNDDSQNLDFRVESDGQTHALFVDGGNNVGGIGTSNPASFNSSGYNLVVGTGSSNQGLTISSGSDSTAHILFADGTSGAEAYDGYISYSHANQNMVFYTGGGNARFAIASNGDLTATDTSISSISDQRLKKDIVDHTYDITKFKQFKPRNYAWKYPDAHVGQPTTGFVAQEVETIDNSWVSENPFQENALATPANLTEEKALCDGGNQKTVKLGKKDAMYVSVIQQLITRIEALEDA